MRSAGRFVGVVIAVAMLAAGCGISTGGAPTGINPDKVPYHLLAPAPPTTTSTTSLRYTVPVTVYFAAPGRQHLVRVSRSVAPPGTLASVIKVLLHGPSQIENDRGITTAFPRGIRLLGATIASTRTHGRFVTVDFDAAFGGISGTEEIVAVAQVVFTVDRELGSKMGVRFKVAGTVVSVPVASGAQVADPVNTADYAALTPTGTP